MTQLLDLTLLYTPWDLFLKGTTPNIMLSNYEVLSFGPASCFPMPNRSVSGVSHHTSQEQEKGEVGRQPRDTGDCRGLESGRGAPSPGRLQQCAAGTRHCGPCQGPV